MGAVEYTVQDYKSPLYLKERKETDLQDINAINTIAFGQPPMTEDTFKRFLDQERVTFLVARDERGRIVAKLTIYIILLDCGGTLQRKAYIEQVATHPKHEGQGLGTKLLKEVELTLHGRLVHTARLTSSKEGAQKFYRKRGWRETSSKVFEFLPHNTTSS
ncbi:MAG: GNAT family N-acetyltransferase [Parcubacteria group bacterium]|nr:GNAT family N-acetyltransferase [Parcubacteria group bacterium]